MVPFSSGVSWSSSAMYGIKAPSITRTPCVTPRQRNNPQQMTQRSSIANSAIFSIYAVRCVSAQRLSCLGAIPRLMHRVLLRCNRFLRYLSLRSRCAATGPLAALLHAQPRLDKLG
mmetsp:Transcript_23141/g.69570  ORF Transcript_23141/g.69570 Transcript_23141/m.69570 type:complete len:116 (+) Transcript_23141:847-1194(+)